MPIPGIQITRAPRHRRRKLPTASRPPVDPPVLTAATFGGATWTSTTDQSTTVGSYPITGYSWALVYAHQPSQARGQALVSLLDWLTHAGQAVAAKNGYIPLPAGVQQLARTTLQQVTGPGGTPLSVR